MKIINFNIYFFDCTIFLITFLLHVKATQQDEIEFILKPDSYFYSSAENKTLEEKKLDKFYKEAGLAYHEYFKDSKAQLILDLDYFVELWSKINEYRNAAVEGNVDYIQTVIDFFKPLQKYDVSSPCLADLYHFFWTTYKYAKTASLAVNCKDCNCTKQFRDDFRKFQWIFDVVDAIGKVPSAVISGNNLWTGSWQTCRKISVLKNRQGQYWNGQYCMARFQSYNRNNPLKVFITPEVDPANVCKLNQSSKFEEWSEQDQKCFDLLPIVNLGLCLPDQCTNYDTQKILQFSLF